MSAINKEIENKKLLKILFVSLNREMHFSYLQQKSLILNAICSNPYFSKIGQIWQTLEKGVNYPVIHYLPLNHSNNDIEMNGLIGGEFTSFQVLYEEIKRIELPVIVSTSSQTSCLTNASVNHHNSAHIFLGFKTLDKTFNTVLEDNWKDWTGARNIYLNLSSDFGLSKICFFRRILSNDFNSFMYILIAHCTHINDKNRILLLDFVDRFRLQRLCGYLTVYSSVSNDNISSNSSLTSNGSDSGNSSDSRFMSESSDRTIAQTSIDI